jgi:hypothetical protein
MVAVIHVHTNRLPMHWPLHVRRHALAIRTSGRECAQQMKGWGVNGLFETIEGVCLAFVGKDVQFGKGSAVQSVRAPPFETSCK